MRRPTSLARVWLASLLGLSACGGPDLSADVAEFACHRSSEAGIACACPEDLNYPSYEACTNEIGEVDEEQACIADMLSAEGDAGKNRHRLRQRCLASAPRLLDGVQPSRSVYAD